MSGAAGGEGNRPAKIVVSDEEQQKQQRQQQADSATATDIAPGPLASSSGRPTAAAPDSVRPIPPLGSPDRVNFPTKLAGPGQQQAEAPAVAAAPAAPPPPPPAAAAQAAAAAPPPPAAAAQAAAPKPPTPRRKSPSSTSKRSTAAAATKKHGPHPMENIEKPGKHDVLLGRGGGINNREGNIKFRDLVKQHKMEYMAAKKVDKPKVAVAVVKLWRQLDPPGRFIEPTPGRHGVYHDIGDKKAQLKASQCLRERTPDVKDFAAVMEKKKRGNSPDILVPVVPVGASMPEDNDVLRWATEDPSPNNRNVEFRSLITSKAYRIVPLYYVHQFQRRCVQRQSSALPPDVGGIIGGDAAAAAAAAAGGGRTGSAEYLALLVEMKASYAEEIKTHDVQKKRKIEERGTQLVTAKTENRYAWVRGIPNGRIELSSMTRAEKDMVKKILHQIVAGDASAVLPKINDTAAVV